MSEPFLTHLSDDALDEVWRSACEEPGSRLAGVRLRRELRVMSGRRTTLLGTWDGADVVVKVFASPRARGNHRRLEAMTTAGLGDLVPTPLLVSASGHVGVLSFGAGALFDTVDDDAFTSAAHQAGEALARLHGSAAGLDRAWTHEDETTQLLRRATPGTLEVCRAVAAEPVDRIAALVPSHRDFHPRQLVVADGSVRLIDLDDAALAPAGLDVGNMVAHLRREAVVGRRRVAVGRRAVEAFLAGYGDVPADVATWERLALARLAGLAESRHQRPAERDVLLDLLEDRPAMAAPTAAPAVLGHADRPVTFVDDDRGALVVKRYTSGAGAAAHEAMVDLWHSPFGAARSPAPGLPEPLGFDARTGELTMRRVDGPAMAVRGEVGRSLLLAEQAAALVADLQASGIGVGRLRSRSRLLRSAARKTADRLEGVTGSHFTHTLEHLTAASALVPEHPELVPTHGDFSPRNLLLGADGPVLIDFDRIQLASPLRDVAYWTAWLWTTVTRPDAPDRLDDDAAWSLGKPFVRAWSQRTGRALTPAIERELDLHRALALVRIGHGWSALRERPDEVVTILGTARDLATAAAYPRA